MKYTKKINNIDILVEQKSTNIHGILFEPYMLEFNNDEDIVRSCFRSCSKEVSDANLELVNTLSSKYNHTGIVEIGVSRNGELSFTNKILQKKPDNIKYLGIDIENKSSLNNLEKNIYTIKSTSFDQKSIRSYLNDIGLTKISLLLIDGWHSLNAVINDWKYSDLLSDSGIVIFHDTNYHAGPAVFLDCIDPNLFKVEKFFNNITDDYGMAVAFKL